MCSLRRRLGLVGRRRGPLATTHHGYLLDPEHVRVDVTSVRTLLGGDVADVTLGLDLMSGKLLADEPYAGWANDARGPSTSCWPGPRRAAQAANAATSPRSRSGSPGRRRGASTAPSRRCAR